MQVQDRSHRKRQKTGNGRPGSCHEAAQQQNVGLCAQVDVDVDCGAVCVALDKYPYFTTGAGVEEVPDPSQRAFHALRLHHKCRGEAANISVVTIAGP